MIGQALQTLKRRPGLILTGFLLGLLAGIFISAREPKLYLATGRITIPGGGDRNLKLNLNRHVRRADEVRNGALFAARSTPVLLRVATDLNMLPAAGATARQQSNAVRALHNRFGITADPDSDVVEITFVSDDPQFAAAAVNRLIVDLIDFTFQKRFESTERASRWPAGQLLILKDEVRATENKMLDLQRQLNLPLYNSTYSQLDRPAVELSQEVTRAHLARLTAESRFRTLQGINGSSPDGRLDSLLGALPGLRSPGLTATRRTLAEARAGAARLLATEGVNHPEVRALNARIRSLSADLNRDGERLVEEARNQYLAAQSNEDQLRAALRTENARTESLGADNLRLKQMQIDFYETRLLYTDLYGRLRAASLDAGLKPVDINILDLAPTPTRSLRTPWWWYVLAYSATGTLLGCVLVLALENLRMTGNRRITNFELSMELPSLAWLPAVSGEPDRQDGPRKHRSSEPSTARENLQILRHPDSVFAEGIRNLRSNLRMSTVQQEPRFILFTSATPSEGKTTVAGNYAVSLAQAAAETGTRILLIDADMRRPNVHHRFGLSGHCGLSSVLSGSATLTQAVQTLPEVPGLAVLAAGPVPPHPSELLALPAWVALLQEAAAIYTHVVIDSPPVLAVTDGVLLAQNVDAVVYVLRQGKTSPRVTRRGRDLLASSNAPLAGLVINALTMRKHE